MFHRLLPVAAILCVMAVPAAAQTRCYDYRTLLSNAAARFGEQPVSLALSARGHTVVTLANLQSGTWTLLIRRADGCTLTVDHGEAWSAVAPSDADASKTGERS